MPIYITIVKIKRATRSKKKKNIISFSYIIVLKLNNKRLF